MNGLKLDEMALKNAVLGGTILGGGGGGSAKKGELYAKLAVDYTDLKLISIENIEEDSVLITASLVGAPGAPDQFIRPEDFEKTVKMLMNNTDLKIGGIITNENGGEATVNGWLQAAILGIPLVDAPCNGRAHPTGVMGSMNLHKDKNYLSLQAAVGGNPEKDKRIECFFKGNIDNTAKMVRLASIEAGGLVAVARNPVTVSYAKKNAAVGGISHAIKTGEAYYHGLETSVDKAISNTMDFLKGSIVTKGIVSDYELRTEGGFDVGVVKINDYNLSFWNEYMTLDNKNERIATFPDLIMTFDAKTGTPLPTSDMKKGLEVYIVKTDMKNLRLSSTMYEKDLILQVEGIVNREMVKYLKY